MALSDEQYQKFLSIYDEVHTGLTWDQSEDAFSVAPDSQWDDENYDGVYRTDSGTWVSAEAVNESFDLHLTEAGFTLAARNAATERLNQSNR